MSTEHCGINIIFWSRSSTRSLLLACLHAQEDAKNKHHKTSMFHRFQVSQYTQSFIAVFPSSGKPMDKSEGLLLMFTAHSRTDHPLTNKGRLLPDPDDPVASQLHPPLQPSHTLTSTPAAQPAASATSPAPSQTAPSPASPRPARWP